MNRVIMLIGAVVLLGAIYTDASAQGRTMWKGGGGWGPGTPYVRMYNLQSVEMIDGEVVSVERIRPGKGMAYGIHIILKTDKETIPVHLGPAWYIENQDVRITAHDRVEVRGSRITFEGKPALIAAELRKEDQVLVLRDANGFPMWSGWRRR
ncbi:MAG: hypothetical protein A4E57_00856 [Syntrophorhabdaceae bacterium PtaU1.Bin034]|jgi:hypothetical protein|nr:MAG: hypothetical protein A4E57_00856 [Syntrophorhabdaceae bacterium PtaU1.Bin034]